MVDGFKFISIHYFTSITRFNHKFGCNWSNPALFVSNERLDREDDKDTNATNVEKDWNDAMLHVNQIDVFLRSHAILAPRNPCTVLL